MNQKTKKYLYLLEYLNKNNIKFGIYLDYNTTSFPNKILFLNTNFFKKKFFIKIELMFWLLLKKIKRSNVCIIDDIDKIKDNDILISFSWENLDTNYHGLDNIINKKFIKIFHFTHYVQRTSLVAKNFFRLNSDFIIAENDLSRVNYFQNFFHSYNKLVYHLPFSARSSLFNKTNFSRRKKCALSVGGIINIDSYGELFKDLSDFYHEKWLQPLRAEIQGNKDGLNEVIEIAGIPIVSGWNTGIKGRIKSIIGKSAISKHYNFDMCDRFNQYQMFLCCEELGGLPGIGFVEGMACGCAYIGKDDEMYRNIGLIPGKHYIGHNGTLEDIIQKITYYKSHQQELKTIAEMGEKFVNENFRPEIIAKKFFKDLDLLSKESLKKRNKNDLNFHNSFIIKEKKG